MVGEDGYGGWEGRRALGGDELVTEPQDPPRRRRAPQIEEPDHGPWSDDAVLGGAMPSDANQMHEIPEGAGPASEPSFGVGIAAGAGDVGARLEAVADGAALPKGRDLAERYVLAADRHAALIGDLEADGGRRHMDVRLESAPAIFGDAEALGHIAYERPDLLSTLRSDQERARDGHDLSDQQAVGRLGHLIQVDDERLPELLPVLHEDGRIRAEDPVAAYAATDAAQRRLHADFHEGRLEVADEAGPQRDLHLLDAWKQHLARQISESSALLVRTGSEHGQVAERVLADVGADTDPAGLRASRDKARSYIAADWAAAEAVRDGGLSQAADVARSQRIVTAIDIRRDPAAIVEVGRRASDHQRPLEVTLPSDLAIASEAGNGRSIGERTGFAKAAWNKLAEAYGDSRDLGDPAVLYQTVQDEVQSIEAGRPGLLAGRQFQGPVLAHLEALGARTATMMRSDDPEAIVRLIEARPDLREKWARDAGGHRVRELSQLRSERERAKEVDAATDQPNAQSEEAEPEIGSREDSLAHKPKYFQPIKRNRHIHSKRDEAGYEQEQQVEHAYVDFLHASVTRRRDLDAFFDRPVQRPQAHGQGKAARRKPDPKGPWRNPEQKAFALPLNSFGGASGQIRKKLGNADDETIKAMYENTLRDRRRLESFRFINADTPRGENLRKSHDMLEMGRRALVGEMTERGLIENAEEVAESAAQFRSKVGENLPDELRRDPNGFIRSGDTKGRVNWLKKRMAATGQATKEAAKKGGGLVVKRGVDETKELAAKIRAAVDQVM